MTDEEFDTYLADALAELQIKQESLISEYGLGSHGRFVVDFEAGTLTFFENERPVVEVRIVPVATYRADRNSLKWAWANEIFPTAIREEAAAVKELYRLTGFDLFKNEYVECDESMAWEITALACKCLGTLGAYRIPSATVQSYVLMKQISWYSQAG